MQFCLQCTAFEIIKELDANQQNVEILLNEDYLTVRNIVMKIIFWWLS